MAFKAIPELKKGDGIVQADKKYYEDFKARPGEKALVLMHTIPFEGSVGLINQLTATRLNRKGYETTVFLYGPGILMAARGRGFPSVGTEGFPGNMNFNAQLQVIMNEGAEIVACGFAMAALYGYHEGMMMEGVKIMHPLDLLDCVIEHHRANALIIDTWTV
jgi:uncharacterized repeat protein (TIGR04044 family)